MRDLLKIWRTASGRLCCTHHYPSHPSDRPKIHVTGSHESDNARENSADNTSPSQRGSREPDLSGMTPLQADFYQSFRKRIRTWLVRASPGAKYAETLLLAPDLFHLLCRLSVDKRVAPLQKAKLLATIAYFVVPIGVVPEALVGPIGYIDDVALAAYVLHGMMNSGDRDIVLEHWAGDKDLLSAIQGVLEIVDSAIASGLWRRLKGVKLPTRRN